MSQSPTTHLSLLVRVRDPTDREAWERFVELYGPVIYGFFRKRTLQDADAADLTQDVLQVVAKGAKSFVHDGAEGAFRGWLYGIARHKLQHFLTRRQRKGQGSGDTASLERMEAIPSPDEDAQVWEREHERRVFAWAAEQVRACVDPSTWQAFWQTAVDGKSGEQVAAALGMSVGAV
ncbi:MAG TPA: sigma-70 family RNA polymerase sigma factor [Thermoguttaceae bacterium]|nr:sigma-70 family RNA polymerase sigma factor [Thermoguttaceae bacterium]